LPGTASGGEERPDAAESAGPRGDSGVVGVFGDVAAEPCRLFAECGRAGRVGDGGGGDFGELGERGDAGTSAVPARLWKVAASMLCNRCNL